MEIFWLVLVGGVAVYAAVNWGSRQLERNQLIRFGTTQASRIRELERKLPMANSSDLSMKPGETFVMTTETVALVETRRAARISRRSTDAFTFQLAKGFFYTAAVGKSVSQDPDDELRVVDYGTATFTTKRVVFVGETQTREWDFSRLLGKNVGAGGRVLMAVSNRQKMSGLERFRGNGIVPSLLLDLAFVVRDEGFAEAKRLLLESAKNLDKQVEFVRQNPKASNEDIEAYFDSLDANTADDASEAVELDEKHDGRGQKELAVVGTFYHREAFSALRQKFGTPGNSEHLVEADLRPEPENPYSESGMAVAVYVSGTKVGYIPELLSPKIFEALEGKGGSQSVGARLWLDEEDSYPPRDSVTLVLDSRMEIDLS